MGLFSRKKSKIAKRADGWINAQTGLGTLIDRSMYSQVSAPALRTDRELEDLYVDNAIAAVIVDELTDAALSADYTLRVTIDGDEDSEISELAKAFVEDEFDLTEKVKEARKSARLFGGSAIFYGCPDAGGRDEYLDRERIRNVKFLHVYDKTELMVNTVHANPNDGDYGQHASYRVTDKSFWMADTPHVDLPIMDASRTVTFQGVFSTKGRLRANRGWGDSVLQRTWDGLRNYGVQMASLDALIGSSDQVVYKIKGLTELIAAGFGDELSARFREIEMKRGVNRAVMLDTEEAMERVTSDMEHYAKVVVTSMQRLSAETRIPMTVLFGVSPAGLNATGESDIRQWHGQIRKERKHLRRKILDAYDILLRDKRSPVHPSQASIDIDWPTLWEPMPTEEADMHLKTAQADQIYFGIGAVTEDEVRRSRFAGEDLGTEIALDEDAQAVLAGAYEQAQSEG